MDNSDVNAMSNSTKNESVNSSPYFTPPIKSDQLPAGKKLTKDLVLSKSKGGSLIEIKKIVVWGQKITDCSIVTEIPELEVASMNANKISSLEHFGQCPNLRELFLRSNCIEDLHEIYHLKDLPNLQVLWLAGNPCTKHPKYRSTVIRNLEQLQKLDDAEISSAERANSDTEGFLFEEPPSRPSTAFTTEGAEASAEDALPIDLAERMRPAEDTKPQEDIADQAETIASPPEPLTTNNLIAPAAESDGRPQPSSAAASAALTETPNTVSELPSASIAASVSTSTIGRPVALAGTAPLPRYALTEVRTAVLRLIRLLDQESLELVMHTVRARLQDGADHQQQQQAGGSDIAHSFSLDNL